MIRHCSKCGKEFDGTERAYICPSCKEAQKQEKKAYLREYVKARNKRLGLKHTAVYANDLEWIKTKAKGKRVLICDIIHEIVEKCK